MTIPTDDARDDYTGDGATNAYSYGFKIFLSSDLLVVVRDTNDNETTLVLDTDYSVSGVGDADGGTVTLIDASQAWLTSGFLTTNYILTIKRNRPYAQSTDIRNQGSFLPETYEDALDSLAMQIKQLKEVQDRTLKLLNTEVGTAALTELPALDSRKGKYLFFDASTGNPSAAAQAAAGSVTISSFAETFLDDANAAAVRTTLLAAAASDVTTNTADIATINTNFGSYRRPVLQFVSTETVDVEANTGTSNERLVLFPDGSTRGITSSTFYRFDITQNAVLSGSAQSGLRSGLSEANDTWYAIYAVKVTDSSTDWVAVGDTTLPLQANVATLNSNFGTNGWVYLGLIRNGDHSGNLGSINSFRMSGNFTSFNNVMDYQALGTNIGVGLRLASQASAVGTTLTYSRTSGTGATDIPDNVEIAQYLYARGGTTESMSVRNGSATKSYKVHTKADSSEIVDSVIIGADEGIQLINGVQTPAMDINLLGWTDNVLGVGSNPFV